MPGFTEDEPATEGWTKVEVIPVEAEPAAEEHEAKKPAVEVPPTSEMTPKQDERFKDIKQVLVAGATGKTGRAVVKALVDRGVKVIALVRDPSKASRVLPGPYAGVSIAKGDVYQYATLAKALDGCDAVICATGANTVTDPLGPFSVDYSGTLNLVTASKRAGVKKFVLVTSIGTDDPLFNPLNLFWGVLFWKKRGEEELQRSGLNYTIVRPGGLVSDGNGKETELEKDLWKASDRATRGRARSVARGKGNVVMAAAGTYGVPPKKPAGSIKRSKVAECCIEALVQPRAEDLIVEVISDTAAPQLAWEDLFASASL